MKLLDVSSRIKPGTNINTIEVPAHLRVKVPTGISWFDFVLGGGFTPSTATMFTGDPSVGKSTLIRTVADALTHHGHIVLYNCLEESPEQVKMACERLQLNVGFIIGEDLFVDDVIVHADKLRKKLIKGKYLALVVDSLQELDDGQYDTGKVTKRTPINCARRLIQWARDTSSILVWVHQVTKSGVFVGDNQLKHAVDIHVHFGFDRDKKSVTVGERVLSVLKNRYSNGAVAPIVVEMGVGGRLDLKPVLVDEEEDESPEEEAEEEDLDDEEEAAE